MRRFTRPAVATLGVLAIMFMFLSALFIWGPLKSFTNQRIPDEKLLEIPGITEQFHPIEGTPPDSLQSMSVAAENERFQLLINTATTEIALVDKASNHIWLSNPVDREKDPYAKGENAELLNAQLVLKCFNSYDKEVTYNTFTSSVQSGQYAIRSSENGISVDYVVGKRWDDDAILPRIISRQRFEKILNQIEDEADRNLFYDNYFAMRFVQLSPEDVRPNVTKLDQQKVFGEYGVQLLEGSNSTLLREAAAQWTLMVAVDKGQPSRSGLTADDFVSFRDQEFYVRKDKIRLFDIDSMVSVLNKIGYTLEDSRVDTTNMGLNPPSENRALYKVTIEYRLEPDAFQVQVPLEEIYFPVRLSDAQRRELNKSKKQLQKEMKELENKQSALMRKNATADTLEDLKVEILEKKVSIQDIDTRLDVRTAPIVNLAVLPFFAAAGEKEQGYIFVPDGSGALIHLNSRKSGASAYQKVLYGEDDANTSLERKVQDVEQAGMPVFGMKTDDAAMFAIIESGDAYAGLQANVAGVTSAYNTVCANFNVVPYGTTSLAGTPVVGDNALVDTNYRNVYQIRTFDEKIRVRYRFLYGDQATYTGMANVYRTYLNDQYGLTKIQEESAAMPLFLEVTGTVEIPMNLFGLKYNKVDIKTSVDDLKTMVSQLNAEGISRLNVKYSGCFSGGVQQDTLQSVKLQNGLGTMQELRSLASALKQQDGLLYMGYQLTKIYGQKNQAAVALNRLQARSYGYDLVTGLADPTRYSYVTSPGRYRTAAQSVWTKLDRFDLGVCFEGLGKNLNSDFSEDNSIDRSQTMQIVSQLFADRKADGRGMLMDGSHIYTAVNAGMVMGLPVTSNDYRILDESIPFAQIVLHGYIPYAGAPINFSEDKDLMVLRSIEAGSYPCFKLAMDADTSDSNVEEMVAGEYDFWKSDITGIYKKMDVVLGSLQAKEITNHQRPVDGISVTSYEGGTSVIVNYLYKDIVYAGTTVSARGFAVVKERVA